MKRMRVGLIIGCVTIALSGLVGCAQSPSAEKPAQKPAVSATGAEAKVAADFPKDVPVYEGTLIATSGGERKWALTITSPDDGQKVRGFYQKQLEGDGWKRVAVAKNGNVYAAVKGSRLVQVLTSEGVDDNAGLTIINVGVKD